MEGILVTVVLAILTGLAFIAYFHPNEYKTISSVVTVITLMILVGGISYQTGYQSGWFEGHTAEAGVNYEPPFRYWFYGILLIGFNITTMFFYYMPNANDRDKS